MRDEAGSGTHGSSAQTHSAPARLVSTCAATTSRKAPSPNSPHGVDKEAREGAQLSSFRPVGGADGSHVVNPPTCWDAERLSSGKAAPSLAIFASLPEEWRKFKK